MYNLLRDIVKSKKRVYIRLALASFWLIFFGFQLWSMQARGVDDTVFVDGSKVQVEDSDASIVFTPAVDTLSSALLFYPGALVDPRAYAPMARDIALNGYKAVIIKIPYRMAVSSEQEETTWQRTLHVMDSDQTKLWVVGGHSRGGRMAVAFAEKYHDRLDGMLLVATSHPREKNLSGLSLPVMKIYGSEDGLASEAEIKDFASNLPADTQWHRVEGANHQQFAWYGSQLGGGKATISREAQHAALIKASTTFLEGLD